jgi:hypothetical protein
MLRSGLSAASGSMTLKIIWLHEGAQRHLGVSSRYRMSGFNGAASLRTRKSQASSATVLRSSVLQWGRVLTDTEIGLMG